LSDDDPPFHLGFEEPGAGYASGSQRARVFTESWVAARLFCPACGERRLQRFANNSPVADFHCGTCAEEFELKSQRGRFGPRVADGAYEAKLKRLASDTSPNLALMNYDLALRGDTPSRSSRRRPGPRQEGLKGNHEPHEPHERGSRRRWRPDAPARRRRSGLLVWRS